MNLTPHDLAAFKAIGISASTLEAARVVRVTDTEAKDDCGIRYNTSKRLAGIAFPYINREDDAVAGWRVRRDHPEQKSDGTAIAKYVASQDRKRLYFGPGGCFADLSDTAVPVVFAEAEKSVLAIYEAAIRTARRHPLTLGTGGCWGWRGVIGKTASADGERVDEKGPLPDLDRITWQERDVTIVFDANAKTNEKVQIARRALAAELRRRGARVRIADLPVEDGINGPDDYIGRHGAEAFWSLIDDAKAEEFIRDDKERIIREHLDNIRLALSRLGLHLDYDQFANIVRVNGAPLEDLTLDDIWVRIDDNCGFRPSKETLLTVLLTEAHKRPFHPVQQLLASLTWDGIPRLDSWLTTYGGAPETAYTRAVGALPLLAAVRRVRHPGAKFDELLVLESPQGALKSTALRALCPKEDWFSDDLPLGVDSKVVIERTSGRWMLEAAELHGNRGREAEALKAFLSRQTDGPVRLAYGRLPVTVPRQFVLIGTTNHASYLKDPSGARRFWPVSIQAFDIEALRRDRDQLWAEAAVREAAGESIRLDPSLWAAAQVEQEDRRAGDPWEDVLDPVFTGDGIVTVDHVPVADVWAALKLEANHLDNRHADRVAAIAQRHGFTKKRKVRVTGKPTTCWVRADEEMPHETGEQRRDHQDSGGVLSVPSDVLSISTNSGCVPSVPSVLSTLKVDEYLEIGSTQIDTKGERPEHSERSEHKALSRIRPERRPEHRQGRPEHSAAITHNNTSSRAEGRNLERF